MIKKYIILFISIFTFIGLKGQTISVDGKVTDFKKKPVERATVYLLKQKDSSIINYTATNREGNFLLKTGLLDEPTILKIDAEKLNSFTKKIEKINESLQLGEIELEKSQVFNIKEIKLTVSPIKIKKDTIEFSTSAIKVRPDSKVEELLRQIPGIEIWNDGKVTVNGKEVDQVIVDGKPFFDKDGKIAIKNLPADIIKSIQITTTKSKEEELSGKTSKSNKQTINLKIDEKKKKGLISRLALGYGSDKRYEGSGFANYFRKNTKISVLASSNNINSRGFSNDEIFDSMGSGRNAWLVRGGNTKTTVGSSTYYLQNENNNTGILKSTILGLNYSNKIAINADLDTFSFMHSDNNLESRSKITKTVLLPDNILLTNTENNGENRIRQYSFDGSLTIKLDSLTSLNIIPAFTRSQSFNFGNLKSSTLRDNVLLNENNSYTNSDSQDNSFTPNIFFSKKFKKKGRVVSATVNTLISELKSRDLNKSQTIFYQDSNNNVNRNQRADNTKQNNTYRFQTGYTEPISDSLNISFNMNYSATLDRKTRNVNDFNENTKEYSEYNTLLSNIISQKINTFSPGLSFEFNKKKFNVMGDIGVDITDLKVNSVFDGHKYNLQRNTIIPYYLMSMEYEFSQNKKLVIYGNANFINPSGEQLNPYTDFSNPLIALKGNPELKGTWQNRTDLFFTNYNIIKNMNLLINASFTYTNNEIVNDSYYTGTGKQLISYLNISGNKNFSIGGSLSKTFKWGESKFTIYPKFTLNYAYRKGFTNGQMYSSNLYVLSPELNFTYEIKDKLIVKPSFKLQYNLSKYTNYTVDKLNTTNKVLKLEITDYFLHGRLFFGNDFEYNRNSNIAPGFKKDFYLWNTSLGYSFFKKQIIAKIKVYDVLNQNQSIKRVISDSYFEDREDLILKRYIMFSLTMDLNRFSKKKI